MVQPVGNNPGAAVAAEAEAEAEAVDAQAMAQHAGAASPNGPSGFTKKSPVLKRSLDARFGMRPGTARGHRRTPSVAYAAVECGSFAKPSAAGVPAGSKGASTAPAPTLSK